MEPKVKKANVVVESKKKSKKNLGVAVNPQTKEAKMSKGNGKATGKSVEPKEKDFTSIPSYKDAIALLDFLKKGIKGSDYQHLPSGNKVTLRHNGHRIASAYVESRKAGWFLIVPCNKRGTLPVTPDASLAKSKNDVLAEGTRSKTGAWAYSLNGFKKEEYVKKYNKGIQG